MASNPTTPATPTDESCRERTLVLEHHGGNSVELTDIGIEGQEGHESQITTFPLRVKAHQFEDPSNEKQSVDKTSEQEAVLETSGVETEGLEVSLDTGTLQSPDITLAETTFNNTMTSEFPEMPAVVAMKSRIHTDDHLGDDTLDTSNLSIDTSPELSMSQISTEGKVKPDVEHHDVVDSDTRIPKTTAGVDDDPEKTSSSTSTVDTIRQNPDVQSPAQCTSPGHMDDSVDCDSPSANKKSSHPELSSSSINTTGDVSTSEELGASPPSAPTVPSPTSVGAGHVIGSLPRVAGESSEHLTGSQSQPRQVTRQTSGHQTDDSQEYSQHQDNTMELLSKEPRSLDGTMSETDVDLNTVEGLEHVDFTTASDTDGLITDEDRPEVHSRPGKRIGHFIDSEAETLSTGEDLSEAVTDKLLTANPYGRTSHMAEGMSSEADDTTAADITDDQLTDDGLNDQQLYELETVTSSDLTPEPSITKFEVVMIDHDEMQIPMTSAYNTESEDELGPILTASMQDTDYSDDLTEPSYRGSQIEKMPYRRMTRQDQTSRGSTMADDKSRIYEPDTTMDTSSLITSSLGTLGTSTLLGGNTVPHYRTIISEMKEALSDAQTAGSSSSSDPDSTDNSQTDRYIPPTRTQSYTGTSSRAHVPTRSLPNTDTSPERTGYSYGLYSPQHSNTLSRDDESTSARNNNNKYTAPERFTARVETYIAPALKATVVNPYLRSTDDSTRRYNPSFTVSNIDTSTQDSNVLNDSNDTSKLIADGYLTGLSANSSYSSVWRQNMKRLEDTVLRGDNTDPNFEPLSVRTSSSKPSPTLDTSGESPTPAPTSTAVPARIREILTTHLSTEDLSRSDNMATPSVDQLSEENRMLQLELNRVEDLLSASRAERDEVGIRYAAISERLEAALRLDNGGSDAIPASDDSTSNILQKNADLQRRLDDEHSTYKRKLQAYHEGQQKQGQLVQKLQAKVLQYKKKVQNVEEENEKLYNKVIALDQQNCGLQWYSEQMEKQFLVLQYKRKCADLEEGMHDLQIETARTKRSLHSTQDSLNNRVEITEAKLRAVEMDHGMDIDTALVKLEEEQQRSASLADVNSMLREQLDKATAANHTLNADIHKLTHDLQRTRQELEAKESEWREEEQSFNEYYSAEHGRLLSLWREVVAFRRQYSEMKGSAERDLSHLRNDVSRISRNMHSACLNFGANQRSNDTQSQVNMDRERTDRMSLEAQLREKVRECIDLQAQLDSTKAETNTKISEMNLNIDKYKMQVNEKERQLAMLQNQPPPPAHDSPDASIEPSPSRVTFASPQGGQEMEEIEAMHEALRCIAQEVINDTEQATFDDSAAGEADLSTSVIPHKSPRPGLRGASPRRTKSPARSVSPSRSKAPTFADSTYAAVQAALNKRQLQVSELRAKLGSSKDQSGALRKQLDDMENSRRQMEQNLLQTREERDNSNREQQESIRTQERLRTALDVASSEKSQLERVRQSLNEQIDQLNTESGRLQNANSDLQRQRDSLEDEKDDVNKDKDRQGKELQRSQSILESTEQRLSRVKEDLAANKEQLHATSLNRDVLEQEKNAINDALSQAEIAKAELELEVNKVKAEEASLRDALLKMQSLNEGLGQDKIELNKIIMQMENEKSSLHGAKQSVEQEKMGLKEELVRVEQEKLDLDTEKQGITQTLEMTEQNRGMLEKEISALNHDRAELNEQVNMLDRQKSALAEELLSTRKEIERLSDTIVRMAKEKEELTHDKGTLAVQVTASERECRQQSEIISGLKSDKDSLETNLYETQQVNVQLDTRKEQLEGENQELLLKKENLMAECQRLRKEMEQEIEKLSHKNDGINQKLAQTEKDMTLALKAESQAHEEDVERLTRERDNQRLEMTSQREEIVERARQDKEELTNHLEQTQNEWQQEVGALSRERDEQLLMAENDKQQAMSLLEQDKSILGEKISFVQAELANAQLDCDRLKREAAAADEQAKNAINNLNGELRKLATEFDDNRACNDKELKNLNNQILELQQQKEAALREVAELKVQLKMAEETRDTIRRDLIESNRKIREGEEKRDVLRKDVVDLKRGLNEETQEKELVAKTAGELRQTIKREEADKVELQRVIQEAKHRIGILEEQHAGVQKEAADLRTSLRDVEKARLESRREAQDLHRQLKQLNGACNKLTSECKEYQARVAHMENKDEESRRDNFQLKQKLVETESSCEVLRKELSSTQRRAAEFEDESQLRERELQRALDDSHACERRLDEQRRTLTTSLDGASAEIGDLKLRLSGSEGRVDALEAQLARVEGARRDVEYKLSSVHSSLRRTLGMRTDSRSRSISPGRRTRTPSPRRSRPTSPTKGFDNTFATTTDGRGSPIPRTGSPIRAGSPGRTLSPARSRNDLSQQSFSVADIDPEAVRAGLRDFVQTLANAERERDDALSQMRSLATHNAEVEDDRSRIEMRLQQLQKTLTDSEEDKKGIDSRLGSAQTALMLQEETIRRNERERKQMMDNVAQMERAISSLESDNRTLQDKVVKGKALENRQEEDRKQLRVSLDDAENRNTKAELMRRALEGDIQRLKLANNDKETENQALQARVEHLQRNIQDLEGKCQSLQLTIDRMSLALASVEQEGSVTKDKVQTLNMSLSDSAAAISELQERIAQLQRALTSSEHDRRVLQERLETTRNSFTDAKKQNVAFSERVNALQTELADSEVRRSEVECQVRQSHTMLVQRQESEQELNQRLQKNQADKQALQERIASLQRSLANAESEKRDIGRNQVRLDKDNNALKKTLGKVEREKLRSEEFASKSVLERESMDRNINRLDEENRELQKHLQSLQGNLAEAEQQHSQRLIDLTTRHRNETEMETERLRSAQLQAERSLESRERAHRQRVKGLEEQISTLKDQLSQEMRKRQQYLSHGVSRPDEDIANIHNALNTSLGTIAHNPSLDHILLSEESRKLDELVDDYSSPKLSTPSARRQRSPHRATSTPLNRGSSMRSPILSRRSVRK